MPSIRKLPVRIDEKKHKPYRSEYLIPRLDGVTEPGFISIKNGRTVQIGTMVFVGSEVTPEMLLERFCERNPAPLDTALALRRLSAFVEALHAFKIGNVLAVDYSAEGLPVLRIEQDYFVCKPDTRLP
jgi:hypothetical protein